MGSKGLGLVSVSVLVLVLVLVIGLGVVSLQTVEEKGWEVLSEGLREGSGEELGERLGKGLVSLRTVEDKSLTSASLPIRSTQYKDTAAVR